MLKVALKSRFVQIFIVVLIVLTTIICFTADGIGTGGQRGYERRPQENGTGSEDHHVYRHSRHGGHCGAGTSHYLASVPTESFH